jgi:hypothetical protein
MSNIKQEMNTTKYSPKHDRALVSTLSKEIKNGEDNIVDYDITKKIQDYSQTRVSWFLGGIKKSIATGQAIK